MSDSQRISLPIDTAGFTMTDATTTGERKGRIDPLTGAAGVFFLIAILFAAAPALRAGANSLAGLLLLTGLAAVAFIGLLAFRSAARDADDGELDLELFTAALTEPAAVAASDGRLLAANAGWREAVGAARRLPRSGAGAGSLFAALTQSRRNGQASARVRIGADERVLGIADLGADRFLLRLAAPTPDPDQTPVPAQARAAAAQALDAFASASPFGAALLSGEEVFSARIVEANSALLEMTGGAAARGSVFGELIDPSARVDAGLGVSEGRAGPIEVCLAHDPKRIAHLYLSRTGDSLVAYLVDVSAQKQIELQLSQAQKMQAIGQLAGGVAHDFNNLLTAIQLRLDELLLRHPLGDPSYDGLSEIRQTAVRAAGLVRKLLAFSRKQTVQRETLELGELISEFEVLLRRLLREDVRLVTDYGRNLPMVRADKGQLETAVMNLAVNARDAVRSHGGGTVKIRTARVSPAEANALGYAGPPVGEMALIEVADDGPGISQDVIDKIFEPFFTTKAVGEGTGLGLATVYGIVKQSDGWIHVHSRPGEGAAFRIFLPVWVPPPTMEAPAPVQPPKPRTQARDLSGAGRILFVEDEEAVRGVAARLLRARGYEVIEACDGEEALILCEENAGKIDLLISDVIMPGMDGPTLLKRARKYLGEAPVMFISGYAEAEFSEMLEGETGVSFLPKPINITILAERVKQELQAA